MHLNKNIFRGLAAMLIALAVSIVLAPASSAQVIDGAMYVVRGTSECRAESVTLSVTLDNTLPNFDSYFDLVVEDRTYSSDEVTTGNSTTIVVTLPNRSNFAETTVNGYELVYSTETDDEDVFPFQVTYPACDYVAKPESTETTTTIPIGMVVISVPTTVPESTTTTVPATTSTSEVPPTLPTTTVAAVVDTAAASERSAADTDTLAYTGGMETAMFLFGAGIVVLGISCFILRRKSAR